MAIKNHRKMNNGKLIRLTPTGKQNKFLLSIGFVEEYGSEFNGYGYKNRNRVYILDAKQVKQYNKLGKIVQKTQKQPKSDYEIKVAWCNRLVSLTGIDLDVAIEIANEKLEYKDEQIEELEDRQHDRYSRKREQLINKIMRSNPLRRIKDKEHAIAILSASDRHNYTDYEIKLSEGRDLASVGTIDKSEVHEYARQNYSTNTK